MDASKLDVFGVDELRSLITEQLLPRRWVIVEKRGAMRVVSVLMRSIPNIYKIK